MEKVKEEEIFEALEEILGKRTMAELINAFERKLKIIEEIGGMNLPVSDWDDMEKEIIKGAVE